MEELKAIKSIGETVEDYFLKAMLESLNSPSVLAQFGRGSPNIRNEAYYAKPVEFDPTTHCAHCGQSLPEDDPYF